MQPLKQNLKKLSDNTYFAGGIILVVALFVASILVLFRTIGEPNQPEINLTETASDCSISFSVGHTPDITDFEIVKTFKTLNGDDLGNSPVNPLEQVILEVSVTNIGNTLLNDLSIDDPLDNTYIEKGAANLELISFESFVDNPSDICVYSQEANQVLCEGISLLPQESFVVSFIVTLAENLGVSKDVINVVRVINNEDNTVKYTDDLLITQAVSNICDFEIGFCTQVLRDKLPGETSCLSDQDCVVETPKHFSCLDSSCALVDGEGEDKCSEDSDCTFSTCEDDSCVTQSCSNGDCISSCSIDDDCVEPTRTICESKSCVVIQGEGKSECDEDSDCIYYTCSDQDTCVSETCENGDCESSCDTDTDCEDENYRVCRNESCVEVSGEGEDECSADIDCEILDYTDPQPIVPETAPNEVYAIPETGIERSLEVFYISLFATGLIFAALLVGRKFSK